MNWLDILLLVTVALGAALGFWSGLLWQVARILSLGISLYAAIVANSKVAEQLAEHWKDATPLVHRVAAFIAVFALSYLVLYLITRIIHDGIRATRLELFDRLLGAILGAAKTVAV